MSENSYTNFGPSAAAKFGLSTMLLRSFRGIGTLRSRVESSQDAAPEISVFFALRDE
jgi:hypothetical protein